MKYNYIWLKLLSMRRVVILVFVLVFTFCKKKDQKRNHGFSKISISTFYKDTISVRAIAIYKDTLLGFGFDKGYGFINLNTKESSLINLAETDAAKTYPNWVAEQRAIGFNEASFFALGIGAPARLRKVNLKSNQEKIVYTETHDKVFYDALAFWNDKEAIAVGDPTDNCLSVIITRDGGETWKKVTCDHLPHTVEGEAAFAASNGNIAIVGDHTWMISGGIKSRVFYSPDKGNTWTVYQTPLIQGDKTQGGYAIHFYDTNIGVIFGGDYTKPDNNTANKAITLDGGRTWKLISDTTGPGYRSCVRFIPNSAGKEMVAVGFKGISISNDYGEHWVALSKEGFYTLRFINDNTAIAAGKGRIAKVTFE